MLLQILIDNPLLTFCIVAALGYLLGRVRIGGSSLGMAAVLFAGLVRNDPPAVASPDHARALSDSDLREHASARRGLLVLAATLRLGRSFGIVATNRGIQTGGLYRIVRHPIYAAYVWPSAASCSHIQP
jgi:hypothetical protein